MAASPRRAFAPPQRLLYPVLGLHDCRLGGGESERLVVLRNPFGPPHPEGRWGPASPLWRQHPQVRAGRRRRAGRPRVRPVPFAGRGPPLTLPRGGVPRGRRPAGAHVVGGVAALHTRRGVARRVARAAPGTRGGVGPRDVGRPQRGRWRRQPDVAPQSAGPLARVSHAGAANRRLNDRPRAALSATDPSPSSQPLPTLPPRSRPPRTPPQVLVRLDGGARGHHRRLDITIWRCWERGDAAAEAAAYGDQLPCHPAPPTASECGALRCVSTGRLLRLSELGLWQPRAPIEAFDYTRPPPPWCAPGHEARAALAGDTTAAPLAHGRPTLPLLEPDDWDALAWGDGDARPPPPTADTAPDSRLDHGAAALDGEALGAVLFAVREHGADGLMGACALAAQATSEATAHSQRQRPQLGRDAWSRG